MDGMKKQILFALGGSVLIVASVLLAWQLAAPTGVSNADAETFARANQLYGNGNYDAAANLYQQLIASGIENADVFYNLGATYTALGNAKQAGEMYARARELNPRDGQLAQAANGGGVPLAQNEIALLAFVAVGLGAIVFLLLRPISFSKRTLTRRG